MDSLPLYRIFPYESGGCVVFDDPERGLHQEELCRGADTLWRLLLEEKSPGPTPDAKPALLFSHRRLEGRVARLHYLRQSTDDWSVWRVDYDRNEGAEVQLCRSLYLYYPTPPPLLYLCARWFTADGAVCGA